MKSLIEKTYGYIKEKQMGESTGHDWWHTKRVYEMAVRLAKAQTVPVDLEIVELAALLHDIEDWKFNDGDEEAGPRAAKAWLEACGAAPELVAAIMVIIHDLSYKGGDTAKMEGLEGRIVQDADRLDAVGAVGIARCFAFGGAFGNEVFNPTIPPRLNISGREYKDRNAKSTTVNHFYEKLLLLKDLYNTEEAKKIGLERHTYMKQFLERLLTECGAGDTEFVSLLKEM